MPWTITRRSAYEAALRRATRALFDAQQHAIDSGSEIASQEVLDMIAKAEGLRKLSLSEKEPKVPKPIRGQRTLDDELDKAPF